nr:MAG TPA: hypothetical protein [Caudoviricetes sp.]
MVFDFCTHNRVRVSWFYYYYFVYLFRILVSICKYTNFS